MPPKIVPSGTISSINELSGNVPSVVFFHAIRGTKQYAVFDTIFEPSAGVR